MGRGGGEGERGRGRGREGEGMRGRGEGRGGKEEGRKQEMRHTRALCQQYRTCVAIATHSPASSSCSLVLLLLRCKLLFLKY